MKYIKWLWHKAGNTKGAVASDVVLACFAIALNLFFIWLSKGLVDIATSVRADSHIMLFAAMLVVTMLMRVMVNALRSKVENNAVYRMQFIIR